MSLTGWTVLFWSFFLSLDEFIQFTRLCRKINHSIPTQIFKYSVLKIQWPFGQTSSSHFSIRADFNEHFPTCAQLWWSGFWELNSSWAEKFLHSTDGMNHKLKRCDQWWETDGYYYHFSLLGCSSHYSSKDPLTGIGPELLLLILHHKTPQRKRGELEIINLKGTNH